MWLLAAEKDIFVQRKLKSADVGVVFYWTLYNLLIAHFLEGKIPLQSYFCRFGVNRASVTWETSSLSEVKSAIRLSYNVVSLELRAHFWGFPKFFSNRQM